VGPVHGHAVDPVDRQRPPEALLGLGELALAGQRPTHGQVHDPVQWLGFKPLGLDDRRCPSGQGGGRVIVVLVVSQ
jgi:hypothetical protein